MVQWTNDIVVQVHVHVHTCSYNKHSIRVLCTCTCVNVHIGHVHVHVHKQLVANYNVCCISYFSGKEWLLYSLRLVLEFPVHRQIGKYLLEWNHEFQ